MTRHATMPSMSMSRVFTMFGVVAMMAHECCDYHKVNGNGVLIFIT